MKKSKPNNGLPINPVAEPCKLALAEIVKSHPSLGVFLIINDAHGNSCLAGTVGGPVAIALLEDAIQQIRRQILAAATP